MTCNDCKLAQQSSINCQLGHGSPLRDIVVITDTPMVDKRSMQYLSDTGIDMDDIYIASAVACYTPKGKSPTKAQVARCRRHLMPQLKRAKFVLLIGAASLLAVLDKTGIKKLHGKPIQKDGVVYLPVMSPAIVFHDPGMEPVVRGGFRTFKDIIDFDGVPEEEELNYTVVDTPEIFAQMLSDLRGVVSSDLETTGLYQWEPGGHIVSLGFGTKNNQWIIPMECPESPWSRDELEDMLDSITQKLDDMILVGHNWKFDALWLKVRFGVDWPAQFDTMLAHFLLDENDRHGLKHLAQKYLGAPDWDLETKAKTGWSPLMVKYHAHDLFYTRELYYVFLGLLRKEPEVHKVFKHILMPCSEMFTQAEFNGVYIDTEKMDDAEEFLLGELNDAKSKLAEYGDINWRSAKQLGELLYDTLGIPEIEKTKAGGRSVSESVLKRLDHPLCASLLKYRAADKQLTGFIEGWKPKLVKSRLHPSFKLIGTVTGRLSCVDPNLQQVPRDPRIRSLVTAPKGWILLECDLSQIELRIAAELANERNMLDAFHRGIDTHWRTAMNELNRGGGGDSLDLIIRTTNAFLDKIKLPQSRGTVEVLAEMWKDDGSGPEMGHKLWKGEVKPHQPTPRSNQELTFDDRMVLMYMMGPDIAQEISKDWKELRKKAKAVNFGFLFGMWWKKFKEYARDNYGVHVTDKQAKEAREAFFHLYPDFEGWHNRQRRTVRRQGYVESLSGRRRRLPRAMDREDTPERREAERQSINSPVQSFANDLNLMSALQIHREFPRSKVRIVGTVHDAILMEVKLDHIAEVAPRVLEIMKHPNIMDKLDIELSVPILADGSIGPWGSGMSVEKYLSALTAKT